MKLYTVLLLALSAILAAALAPPSSRSDSPPRPVPLQSRAAFFSSAASLLLIPSMASAKSVDPKLAGTKKDPKFEACLSQCMYECTKPKGEEQRSRTECLPECKQKCAVNKEQLMLGVPIKKDD